MNETTPQPNFESKKRNYFVRLALKYRDLMQLHRESGQIDRMKPNPDYPAISKNKEVRWGDVTDHTLVEAAGAEILADMVKLPDDEKEKLIRSVFIHDWRKREEIVETKGVTDPDVIEDSNNRTKELLQGRVDGNIIDLSDKVTHISLPYFAELQPDKSIKLRDDLPLSALLMHYLDDITKQSDIVSFDERMDYLDEMAKSGRYSYNEQGRKIWGDRTFFEAQREVGHLIEDKIAKIIGLEDPKKLPSIIKEKLIQKIEESAQ